MRQISRFKIRNSDFEFRDSDFPAKFLVPASPGWDGFGGIMGWRYELEVWVSKARTARGPVPSRGSMGGPSKAGCAAYFKVLSVYVRASQDGGNGTTQMFSERLSSESMADWISIFVPAALKVGCW